MQENVAFIVQEVKLIFHPGEDKTLVSIQASPSDPIINNSDICDVMDNEE